MKEVSVTLTPRELELIKKALDVTGTGLSYFSSSNLELIIEIWALRQRFGEIIDANR